MAEQITPNQQLINVGLSANDGTGDKIRNAFIKVNSNFTELYDLVSQTEDILDNIQKEGNDLEARLTSLSSDVESIKRRLTILEKESLYFNNPMVLESFYISDIDFTELDETTTKKTLLIKEVGDSVIDLFLQWNLSGDKPSQMLLSYGSTNRNVNLFTTESYWTPESPFTTDTAFILTATDYASENGRQIKYIKTVDLKFYDRLYWGASSASIDNITPTIITTAARTSVPEEKRGFGTTLSNSAASAIDYEANFVSDGAYLFFAYPKKDNDNRFTINNVTVEGMMYTAYSSRELTITNQYGVEMQYNVIVFDNKLHGDNIEVTFT